MKTKTLYDLPTTTRFKFQKENRILNALEHFFPDVDIVNRISTSCYDDTIVQECFEKNISKIKDAGLLNIIDNKIPICNYKKMLLYNYWQNLKTHIKMDDFLWDLIERVFQVNLTIIEKNLLPSRKDNPTYLLRLQEDPRYSKSISILHDPYTNEFYAITNE